MLSIEEVCINGTITQRYTIKTKKLETDKNIKVRDFDIRNLKSIGVYDTLKETKLTPSYDKVEANASAAEKVMDKYELIKELEHERLETQTENK